ncbi:MULTISPECIES: bifunctional DNA primase/polymerase [Streptacidiphilus]|uniref:Bifunctional DNA primase/polymerase n=1 Tax=Streptacidiphilus cavernicola TaxID=3342716 RepID=A0ABV6UEF7_9ACTN|nr:bifunctional DNA primase/polymerase [Streptacidiphilus jeojiense]
MWTHESIEYVTVAGEAWLASASEYPRSMRALWESRPWAPTVLPCGRTFDVVNLPGLFGRRVLDELWESGPGCGPVATHRGRILVFAEVGAAQRLRTLLVWEEWARGVPPVLCHGAGDAITVPPVQRMADAPEGPNRWIVAPDTREPWLPGASVLLWACVRAARGGSAPAAPPEPVELPCAEPSEPSEPAGTAAASTDGAAQTVVRMTVSHLPTA